MSWLYETRRYRSEKNGDILCRRIFGRWGTFVGGFHESSGHMAAIWRQVHRLIPKDAVVRDVLLLGLAAGDNIALLNRRFPGCRVTAIEWDPVMVRIMDEIALFPAVLRPEVLLGDAAEVLPGIDRTFDLVIVDLFKGGRVAPAAFGDDFFRQVAERTRPGGSVIVNAFWEPALLAAAGRRLRTGELRKIGNNSFGFFRRLPA